MTSEWREGTSSVEMQPVRPLQQAHISPSSKSNHNDTPSPLPQIDSVKQKGLAVTSRSSSAPSATRSSEHANLQQISRQSSLGFSFGNFGLEHADPGSSHSGVSHSTSRRTLPASRPLTTSSPSYDDSDYISVRNSSMRASYIEDYSHLSTGSPRHRSTCCSPEVVQCARREKLCPGIFPNMYRYQNQFKIRFRAQLGEPIAGCCCPGLRRSRCFDHVLQHYCRHHGINQSISKVIDNRADWSSNPNCSIFVQCYI
jgi:hypothetical protein